MATAHVVSSTIGFPRIGGKREMKRALEAFWAGKISAEELVKTAEEVERVAWTVQKDAGVDLVALDSTLYDQILDFVAYLGLVPDRFRGLEAGLPRYFAMARGVEDAAALDMSKFFDTNYHHLVPELSDDMDVCADWSALVEKVRRGQAAVGAAQAVPIVIGPNTLVHLGRGSFDRSRLVSKLVPAYVAVLRELKALGVPEVQIHEPVLALGISESLRSDVTSSLTALAEVGVPLNLVIYYDDVLPETYKWIVDLPVAALSLDFCGVPGAASGCATAGLIAQYGFPKDKRLGAGIIDGRSVWADDGTATKLLAALRAHLGEEQAIAVQSSVSLQHVPFDTAPESALDGGLKTRLAFAIQKLGEIVSVARSAGAGPRSAGAPALSSFGGAPSGGEEMVIAEGMFSRSEPYSVRRAQQPQFAPFPTTSIGSFPQTDAIRRARLQYKKGTLSEAQYRERIAAEIGYAVGVQEGLGMDVLVHGEAERSDMVEYFGMKLEGFAFTEAGWVQSYGSRYVRPPIIAGDVRRAGAMTVHEFALAQALTARPVKGMLTGPVTILNWSFPRKDITRAAQARQLALALRDEVADLEAAGCRIVQVDEPALREGLPLKPARWDAYLDWAVRAFRLAVAGAVPSMQIVTHLCYSSFEDILPAIDAMDADVLTIENSRSDNEMVVALAAAGYARDLGPGVYDVHSPVVPTTAFMQSKVASFVDTGVLGRDARRIWVNPDCGLKTRRWAEVIPSLRNMVSAAAEARAKMGWTSEAEGAPSKGKAGGHAGCGHSH